MASALASTIHARQLVLTSSQRTSNGIEKNLCSLEYVTVDHIAAGVYVYPGKRCNAGKTRYKECIPYCTVHPEDRPLLAMRRRNGLTRPCRLVCAQPQLFLVL